MGGSRRVSALRLEETDEKTFRLRRARHRPGVRVIVRPATLRPPRRLRLRRSPPSSLMVGWLKIEVGEIIPGVVVQRQQVQSGLGEGDGPNPRFIPDMPTSGGHGEFAFTGRFVVDGEIDRLRLVA